MKATQPLAPNHGFTLIEVMLTLVILSIGILAMARLQIAAIRGNGLSQRMTTAASVAEGKIEQLKNAPFADIQPESPTQVTASNLNFTREVTVTNNSPMANTKTVSVIVTWKDRSKTYTVPLATIIGQ
jgi:type IV pilus assembly protein PilV